MNLVLTKVYVLLKKKKKTKVYVIKIFEEDLMLHKLSQVPSQIKIISSMYSRMSKLSSLITYFHAFPSQSFKTFYRDKEERRS